MTRAGLVSVVVPFLNAERFLGEAIASVLAQTYRDWELLLVDDGSSDASAEIAHQYVARDAERVVYLSYRDARRRGPAAARNLGIEHAKGEYVAFLDADDVWLPNKLERQVGMLATRRDIGMVYGTSQWWYSWSSDPEERGRDYVQPLGVATGVIQPPALLRPCFVLQEAAIPNPTNVLVPRWVIDKVGGFERSVPDGYEDQAFYAKVCVHAPILVSDECWDRYRQHSGSLTAVVSRRGAELVARARFLSWLIAYLSEHGVDREICAALARQRFRYAHPRLGRIAGLAERSA
jgi:glycosyltransferase involved in cell wall biosynthesis